MANRIFTLKDFCCDSAKVGDLVTDEVVDEMANALPPACMRSDCTQCGEPYSYRGDPETGTWRPTYDTFKRVEKGVWRYCGHCFRGENTERGKEAYYV